MFVSIWSTLRRFLRPRGTAAFLGLAALVGVVVGLAAAALIGAIESLEHLFEWASEQVGSARSVALFSVPLGLVGVVTAKRRRAIAGSGLLLGWSAGCFVLVLYPPYQLALGGLLIAIYVGWAMPKRLRACDRKSLL